MRCKRCGRENPSNVKRCMYCNTPFYGSYSHVNMPQNRKQHHHHKKNQNKKTDTAILASIVALALVFTTLVGVYAFQNFAPRKKGFSSGGGGGAIVSSSVGSNNNGAFLLEASKHELEVGTSDNVVYFYAKPKGTVTTVELTDDEGNIIVEMKDDGLYSESGDDLTNDGVYTAKVSVDVTQEHVLYYSAIVNSNQSSKSNVEKINVLAKLTQTELIAIRKVNNSLKAMRNSDSYKQSSIEDKSKMALEQLKQLAQEGLIRATTIYEDKENNTITYYYSSGVIGIERLEEFTPVYGGNSDKKDVEQFNNEIEFFANNQSTQAQVNADLGDALILYAWGEPSSEKWKALYKCCEYFQQKWDGLGLDTTMNSNVTINDLKNIKDKSFVYIAAHGLYDKFKYEYDQKYWWIIKTDSKKTTVTAPVIFILENSTETKDSEYSLDLKTGKIVIHNGEYGIVPAFFDEYYDSDDLENSIFFLGSCQLMGKKGTVVEDWTTTLTSKSIKAFIGFHNSNYIAYHCNLLKEIVPALIEGKTINEALTIGTNAHGTDDVKWYNSTHDDTFWENLKQWFLDDEHPHADAAYPVLRGDKNATLINNELINGNFEANTAVIKGWKKTGDVRLLTKLGEVFPQEGSQMTILTTGIGSGQSTYLNSTEGSSLYQAVRLEKNFQLSFEYNIISEEPTEYVGSKFDDKFYAEILNSKGEVIKTLASETVNNSAWFPVSDINFEGGDDTVYQTGWKKIECDLSEFKGQIVTLRFVVFDVGDSLYDTAAVVDNVILK